MFYMEEQNNSFESCGAQYCLVYIVSHVFIKINNEVILWQFIAWPLAIGGSKLKSHCCDYYNVFSKTEQSIWTSENYVPFGKALQLPQRTWNEALSSDEEPYLEDHLRRICSWIFCIVPIQEWLKMETVWKWKVKRTIPNMSKPWGNNDFEAKKNPFSQLWYTLQDIEVCSEFYRQMH